MDEEYTLPDGRSVVLSSERFSSAETLFHPELLSTDSNMNSILVPISVHTETPHSTIQADFKADAAYGLGNVASRCIANCDIDTRKDFYANIILAGGGTLLRGFAERLRSEVEKNAPQSVRVKIVEGDDETRRHSTWIGGSILASLSTFQEMWISREEYDEHGPAIVHRKCTL